MRLFSKKPDPVSERAKLLNEQIAALEAAIKKLAEQENHSAAAAPSPATAPPIDAHTAPHPQPRLRSTALPHGQTVPVAGQEPIFEELHNGKMQTGPQPTWQR